VICMIRVDIGAVVIVIIILLSFLIDLINR